MAVPACVARTGAPARVSDYRAPGPLRRSSPRWGYLRERLSAFAELIELTLGSSETREELRGRATYDPLTALMNHYAFQDALAREVEAARRDDRPLSLVLADVNHLRQVNELYGRRCRRPGAGGGGRAVVEPAPPRGTCSPVSAATTSPG
jgi:PleD family two-component response regulator